MRPIRGRRRGGRRERRGGRVGSSPLTARRSPLAARSPLAPRPDLSGLLTCREQQPTTLRSRRRPSRPPPTPARHHGEDKLPPTHTLPHPAPHETRRATRCRHPENSLTSPYRASRLHRCALTRFRRGSASPRDAWPLTRPHSLYRAARYAPAAPPARMSAAVGRPST